MDADWTTSPSASRVLQHVQDSRPAWLWSQDGQKLLWSNPAAELFLAKAKKHGLKLAPPAVPIKGQVARNIRLGSVGRTSLARIQFLAGDKPASATCATTPLIWQDGQPALLIVGVDAISDQVLEAAGDSTQMGAADEAPVQTETIDAVASGDSIPSQLNSEASPGEQGHVEHEPIAVVSDSDVEDEPTADAETAYQRELENWREADQDGPLAKDSAPQLQLVTDTASVELPNAEPSVDAPTQSDGEVAAAEATADELEDIPATNRLSQLMDRLVADEDLFTPLTSADDAPPALVPHVQEEQPVQHYTITGRGFLAEDLPVEQIEAEADEADLARLDAEATVEVPAVVPDEPVIVEQASEPVPDAESVERVSRYNFDELSRILNDRVGETQPGRAISEPARTGALINLGGETLVLNRLPLGILVFRDQQVLFANRAITEMIGYDTVESLRAAGLAAVFPASGPDGENAGPVNHLVQRDGTLVPVTARLQSISWQGRPALMLSASATEVRTGHEAAVQAFAQAFADIRGDGFFEATRAGVISAISPKAVSLLRNESPLVGKALSTLVTGSDLAALREFLERPARFAESARPCLTLRARTGAIEIIVFAQGQAGVMTGYFGFVRAREVAPLRLSASTEADPALLARISRGVRRPLNTIIGFSDLIRSEAFGALKNERYETYAQDITTAGHEIAALVDELDDYARLRDGRYLPQRASIELTALLESCVLRIRQQASSARVIVRNAISESLPRITADRASLAQAVLNLLASSIDQTPTGGAVVISAQRGDDGSIAIHVRDSSTNAVDMAERFVVFRDGVGRDGVPMTPVRSSVGLALTRSLLSVNAVSLSVDPAGDQGMLFTLSIPADLVDESIDASSQV